MKQKIAFLFTASLLFVTLVGFAPAEKWFSYASEAYGFRIEFPQEPTESPQTIPSEIGELQMNIFMYDPSTGGGTDDNLLYMVNYTEYPDPSVSSENTEMLEEFFRGALDGAASNVGGTIVSEKEIEIEGYPGREAKVTIQGGQIVIQLRLYLVKSKMYILQTIKEASKDDNASSKRFMDSFALIL